LQPVELKGKLNVVIEDQKFTNKFCTQEKSFEEQMLSISMKSSPTLKADRLLKRLRNNCAIFGSTYMTQILRR
jgi:hypothetical protein